MELATILIIIIAIIALVLFITLIKSIIKIIMYSLGIVLVLIIIFGIIAYSDAKSITNVMETGAKTLIYTQEGEVLTGITIPSETEVRVREGAFLEGVRALSKEEARTTTSNSNQTDLIIIVDEAWVWSVGESYVVHNTNLTRADAHNIFNEEPPETASLLGLGKDELKAYVFFSLFSQALKEADTKSIITGIREETIIIQPPLISTGIIKLIPERAFSTSLKHTIQPPQVEEEER